MRNLPCPPALDAYERQGLQELRWQLGARHLRTEKPTARVGGKSADIFKLEREASSRHGDTAAKKLYFASLKVFVSFILILSFHYPFFYINIIVAITFGKSILTITLLLLSLFNILSSPPLYYAKSSRTIKCSLSRFNFTQKSGICSRMIARSHK